MHFKVTFMDAKKLILLKFNSLSNIHIFELAFWFLFIYTF